MKLGKMLDRPLGEEVEITKATFPILSSDPCGHKPSLRKITEIDSPGPTQVNGVWTRLVHVHDGASGRPACTLLLLRVKAGSNSGSAAPAHSHSHVSATSALAIPDLTISERVAL